MFKIKTGTLKPDCKLKLANIMPVESIEQAAKNFLISLNVEVNGLDIAGDINLLKKFAEELSDSSESRYASLITIFNDLNNMGYNVGDGWCNPTNMNYIFLRKDLEVKSPFMRHTEMFEFQYFY